MAEEHKQEESGSWWSKLDLKTVISVLTICGTSTVFVVGKIADIERRANDAVRETEVNKAEIKRVEQNQITAQRDVRDDLKDISRKIDTLAERLYDRPSRSMTKEWTK
jgi:hypothetical protein